MSVSASQTTAAGARTAELTPWRIQIVGSSHRVLNALNDEVVMFDSAQLEFWQGIVRAVNDHADLVAMLKMALPYVERVAATAPTEYGRQVRQRQACRDADAIRAAIAKTGGA